MMSLRDSYHFDLPRGMAHRFAFVARRDLPKREPMTVLPSWAPRSSPIISVVCPERLEMQSMAKRGRLIPSPRGT